MSNDELALASRCSRQTVNNTLKELVADGFLVEIGKKGTVVRYAFVFKKTDAVYIPRGERQKLASGEADADSDSELSNPQSELSNPQNQLSNITTETVGFGDTELEVNEKGELELELEKLTSSSPAPEQVVWDAYVATVEEVEGKKSRMKFTDKRKKKITRWLKDYSVEELTLAVTGWRYSAWHCGDNPQSTTYYELTSILAEEDRIDKHIGRHDEKQIEAYHKQMNANRTITDKWGQSQTKTTSDILTVDDTKDWDD